MLFSGMIDSIIGYIDEIDSSIRRRFGSHPFFTNQRTYRYFFVVVIGKHRDKTPT